MADRYDVVVYRHELLDDMLELQAHHWGGDQELRRQYFRWKYIENPQSDSMTHIYLAYDGSNLAAMQGAYGAEWTSSTAGTFQLPGKGDMVVHPDHRRRGLSERLTQVMVDDLRDQGLPGVIATSTTAVAHRGMVRSGWKPLEPFHTYRWLGGSRQVQGRAAFLRAALGRLSARILRTQRNATGPSTDNGLRALEGRTAGRARIEPDARPGVMATIQHATVHGWHQRCDQDFYEWRFRNPLMQYLFVYLEPEDPIGFLVLAQRREAESPTLRVVDWGATDSSALSELLLQTGSLITDRSIELALSSDSAAFSNRAFFDASRRPVSAPMVRLFCFPLDPETPLPMTAEGWEWRDVYSDNF